jgi:dihydrofolate synthase/folylpolyglutamate synthase
LIEKIKSRVDIIYKETGERPTYFEVCTMMAFLYFKREGVQFMVLEVGMGGRLDSTNITEALVSVITPISYDHTQYLGTDLKDIALEKCGIIKNNSVVISATQSEEVMDVIEGVSKEKNAKLYLVGRDILFEIFGRSLEKQDFRLMTPYSEYPHLSIKLLGDFQVENAVLAVAAVEALRLSGIFIDSDATKEGLEKARWAGRFQLIQKKPLILVDGAHNAASAAALTKALNSTFKYNRLILVLGTMRDKDIDGLCKELGDMTNYAVATASKNERAPQPSIEKEKR